jgi:hypothetical protein
MSTEYVGKMLDGQMHGHGKLIYENDEFYEGDFVRGNLGLITLSKVDTCAQQRGFLFRQTSRSGSV